MVDIVRPVYGEAWASVGEKVSPALTKIQGGWIQEMMPYQWENFLQNRQDTALLYMLQKGVPEWDASQEYIAGKSVVTYQTNLYISVLDSTNVLPTVQASWKKLNPSTSSSGVVTIAGGGTGASTATEARTNLGIGTSATADFPVSNGLVVKLSDNTLVARTITGTAGYITVTNGNGVSGNPTINVGANVAKTDADASWTTTSSIRLPAGSTAQRGVGAPGRIRFNLESGVYEGYDNTGWNPIGSVGTLDVQNFQGDGIRTTFTLSSTPRSENNTQVYFNGVYQQKNTYNLVGNDLVFDEAPTSDINIEVVNVSSVPIGTTTASQTSIVDSGNYFSSASVEGALQEVGLKASFVKDAILSYPDYAAASAAAATLPDGQEIEAPNSDGRLSRFSVQSGAMVFKDFAPDSISLQSYGALRAYKGNREVIDITSRGIAGRFIYDPSDTATADNGGTVIVSADGRRWKRLYSGTVNVLWFGSNGAAIQSALNAAASDGVYDVLLPAGDYSAAAEIVIPPFVNLRGVGCASNIIASFSPPRGLIVLTAGTGVTGNIAGRYVRDLTLTGNGSGVGLGCDIDSSETTQRFLYGFDFSGVLVQNFFEGFKFQALWHSTIRNCTTSACKVGLLLWGQCVSIHITGCHFRRDGAPRGDVFGIRVLPRVYGWSPDQTKGSRSEAIIIDGETMCIGSDYGIYVDSVLYMHISNVDLDYIGKYAVTVLEADGGFTLSDSWIAADAAYTEQFIGVIFPASSTPQSYKRISGVNMSCENASTEANNIGVSAARWGVIIDGGCNILGGALSVYANGLSDQGLLIRDSTLGAPLYTTGCGGISVTGTRLSGLVMDSIPEGTYNHFRDNSGFPSTHGVGYVPIAAGSTTGTLQIPNAYSGGGNRYFVTKLHQDGASAGDVLSVNIVGLISVTRGTQVSFDIPSPVEWALT